MREFKVPLFVLALVTSASAHAEVVQKSEAGFVVREAATVPADTWATWAAQTSPGKWWSAEHTWSGKAENLYIDSQATGCFCELMPVPEGAPEGTRRGSVEHMHIIHSNPGSVLRMKGGLGPLQGEAVDAVLTITLKTTSKGTRVLWEYVVGGYMRFKVDEIAPAVDKVLGEQLGRMAKALGGEMEASPEKKTDVPKDEVPKDEAPKADAPAAEPAKPDPAQAEPPKTEPMEKAPVPAADAAAAPETTVPAPESGAATAPAAAPTAVPAKPAVKKPAKAPTKSVRKTRAG